MRSRGVGPASQRRVLMVISAVLTAAVEWKKIATNPITHVRKPPATRQRHPRPFPPIVVEQIRHEMLHRATTDPTGIRPVGDALLVTLMSYAGLRPGEALALTFGDIGKRTIAVDKAVADGEERQTKTGRVRTVPLVSHLAGDVAEYREARRDPPDHALVFPSGTARYWSRPDFSNWRARVWKPAVSRLAATDPALAWLARARPYDCRGTFVSLQLRADASPLEVASWAGHSPQVMFSHYAAVIQEMVGEPALSTEEQIARAREAVECRHEQEVIELMVDLLERPTLAAAGGGGAAEVLYGPGE
jgi:integrase